MSDAAAVRDSLYRKEPKQYPRKVRGRFSRLQGASVWVLLGLYYLLPWIPTGGHQSVLFDLPARKFYIFGLVLWPQDFIYLALLLIVAGLSLFFFTALAGRLWCGFACPQTIWTKVFLWLERITEGDRNRRMKLDQAPWSWDKFLRKTVKQTLWILFALWTGFTFVGFFTPIRDLGQSVLALNLGQWEAFWGVFYSFATYGNAGFLREQVCKYMCPYARFQSAMFDRDTLIISYDTVRGEPRGGRGKKADLATLGLGDCIDCTLCVQVCPTGIDIRDGLQYECIACAACIDACDAVMDRMGYARGLVRYTTEHALGGGRTRILRPRILVYAVMLTVILGGILWGLAHRTPLRAELIRDRNVLYRELPRGRVENVYTLKLINMDSRPHRYHVEVPAVYGVRAQVNPEPVLPAGRVGLFTLRLASGPRASGGSVAVEIHIRAEDDPAIALEKTTRMMLPLEPDGG